VSSILLSAPYAKSPVELVLAESKPTSLAYIRMTLSIMKQFGISVETIKDNHYRIPTGQYCFGSGKGDEIFEIEADASSASYPAAFAAVTGSTVILEGVGNSSEQGDAAFAKLLQSMGCKVQQTKFATTITGPEVASSAASIGTSGTSPASSSLEGLGVIDMSTMTDTFMTLAAVAALANGPTEIVNIAN